MMLVQPWLVLNCLTTTNRLANEEFGNRRMFLFWDLKIDSCCIKLFWCLTFCPVFVHWYGLSDFSEWLPEFLYWHFWCCQFFWAWNWNTSLHPTILHEYSFISYCFQLESYKIYSKYSGYLKNLLPKDRCNIYPTE